MTPILLILIKVFAALGIGTVGAFLNRWRGGGFFEFSKPAKLAILSLLLTVGAWFSVGWATDWITLASLSAVFLGAFGGLSQGHGAYFDLGTTKPEKDKDRIGAYQEEGWVGWFLRRALLIFWNGTLFGSRSAYECVAMAFIGMLTTVVLGGFVGYNIGIVSGILIGLVGCLKFVAYGLWYLIPATREKAVVFGEYTNGFLLYGLSALVLFFS